MVFVALLVVLCGAFARYHFLTTWLRQDLLALVTSERLAIAEQAAGAIDFQLIERRSLVERVAAAVPSELMSEPEQLRNWLHDRQALVPFFSLGLAVFDTRGALVAQWTPAASSGKGADVVSSPDPAAEAVAEALQGKTTIAIQRVAARPALAAISPPALPPALPIATPIRDSSGAVQGAFVGISAISDLHLFDTAAPATSREHGGLLLVSPNDKLFVSATDPSMVFTSTPPQGVNLLHDRAMAGYRGTGITVNAKGVEEISAMVSVPTADWFVVARTPTAEAFAAVARTKTLVMRSTLLTLVFVIVFMTGLIWWGLKPLFGVARQADAMTRGEVPLQPLKVARDDEVGHLTAAFNRLLTKLSKTQLELSQLAHHDSLTGLPNRRLLADRLRQSMARSERNNTRVALMVMDLDGFKQINDVYGHDAGDEALRAIAARFMTALRRNDTLARLGGDEFVLLASDLVGESEDAALAVQVIASKCIDIAAQPLVIDGTEVTLGVSIGVALCAGQCDPDQLMEAADRAMYSAKQNGRGRFAFSTWLTDPQPAPAIA